MPPRQRLTAGALCRSCERIRRIHTMRLRINFEEQSGRTTDRLLDVVKSFIVDTVTGPPIDLNGVVVRWEVDPAPPQTAKASPQLWAVAAAPATAPWNVAGGWGTAISPPWSARPPPAPATPAGVTHVAPSGKAAAPPASQQVQSGTSSLSARSPILNLVALETNMVFVHTPPAPEVLEPLVTHVAPPAQAHEVEDEDVTAHFEVTELRPTWDDIY